MCIRNRTSIAQYPFSLRAEVSAGIGNLVVSRTYFGICCDGNRVTHKTLFRKQLFWPPIASIPSEYEILCKESLQVGLCVVSLTNSPKTGSCLDWEFGIWNWILNFPLRNTLFRLTQMSFQGQGESIFFNCSNMIHSQWFFFGFRFHCHAMCDTYDILLHPQIQS